MESFKTRSRSLTELKKYDERLQNVHDDIRSIISQLKSLRLTKTEAFGPATTFGNLSTRLERLALQAKNITKDSQRSIAATFTPGEEMERIIEEEEEEDEEQLPMKMEEKKESPTEQAEIKPGEPSISAEIVSLTLVLYILEMSSKMSSGQEDEFDVNQAYQEEFLSLFTDADFRDEFCEKAFTHQRALAKDILDMADRLYAFVVDDNIDEETLKQARDVNTVQASINENELTDFYNAFIFTAAVSESGLRDDLMVFQFTEKLKARIQIKDYEQQTIYMNNTNAIQRAMVDRAVNAASESSLEAIQKIDRAPRQKRQEEAEKAEDELPMFVFQEAAVKEGEAEGQRVVKQAIPGVDNIVTAGEGELFKKLYTYPDKRPDQTQDERDKFDESNLPSERYRAQTYANNLLNTPSKVAAFVRTQSVSFRELFQMLEALSFGYLAQKPKPDSVPVSEARGARTEPRYEIDIDVRTPKEIKLTARGTEKEFRGMTDLDAEIVMATYLTYLLPIRSILEFYQGVLARRSNAGETVANDAQKSLMDSFLQSQYRFPRPPFDIQGISERDFKRLQELVLERTPEGGNFTLGEVALPMISDSVHTDTDAAIRFRMYKNKEERNLAKATEPPINLIRLINLIQSKAENVFLPEENTTEAIRELGVRLRPDSLPNNWYTNLLISIAKLMLPGATTDNFDGRYFSLHLFASQDLLRPNAEPEDVKNYPLYNPNVVPRTTEQRNAYNVYVDRLGGAILPSSSHALKHEGKSWKQLECKLANAIVDQDACALIAALYEAKQQLMLEKEKGRTVEHLKEHIDMINKKMETAGQIGLSGELVMKAMADVAAIIESMPSGCRYHKHGRNYN